MFPYKKASIALLLISLSLYQTTFWYSFFNADSGYLTNDQNAAFIGRVGINRYTADYQLDVNGNMRVSSGDDSYTFYGPNSSWGGQLFVGATPSRVTTNTAQVVATDGNLHVDSGTNGKALYLQYFTGNNTYINPNGGNVGIGTTSPVSKLQINTPSIGNGEVRLDASGNEAGIGYYTAGDDWVAGVGGWGNSNDFTIGQISGSSAIKMLIEKDTGNVGIGTASPSDKLTVAGNISGGYILGSYFNASAGNSENPSIGQIWTQNTTDNYLRKSTPGHFISQLGLITSGNIGSQSVNYANTSNYANSSTTQNAFGNSGNWNSDFQNTPAYTSRWTEMNGGANAPGSGWWFQQDMRHSNGSNYWGRQMAYGWEDRANQIWTRNVSGNNFGSWYQIPVADGGTYGLSITGNAGYAGSAGNADTVDGYHYDNFIGKNGNGYYQQNTWLQLNGAYGLYAPSINDAHFFPNEGSYGSWKVRGSRNGWYGLEFDNAAAGATTMMMGTTGQGYGAQEVGWHNNGNGWIARFTVGRYYGKSDSAGYADSAGSAGNADTVDGYHLNQGVSTGNAPSFAGMTINRYANINNGDSSATLELQGQGTGDVGISFHRPGAYASKLIFGTDNKYHFGGWSDGTNGGTVVASRFEGRADSAGNSDTVGGLGAGSFRQFNTWQNSHYSGTDGAEYSTINYDSNDSGYYTDPNGTSRVNLVNANTLRSYGKIYMNENFGQGLVGRYDPYRYQAIFSMGDAYNLATDGTNPGNLYGLAWTHNVMGGESRPYLGHQMLVMDNGKAQSAIGIGIWTKGDITAAGSMYAPAYYYSSDARLKHDVVSIETPSALEKIRQINPVTFTWNDTNKKDVGFIAQEVEKIYPDLVTTNEQTGMKAVKYGNLVAPAIAGIKELDTKQVELEKKVSELQDQVNMLEIEKLKNIELESRIDRLEKLLSK